LDAQSDEMHTSEYDDEVVDEHVVEYVEQYEHVW
jgi:hypothetical protein